MHLFLCVGVNEMLDLRNSTLEAAKARIAELESVIIRRDMIIADQKRFLEQVKEEYQEKLEVHRSLNDFIQQVQAYYTGQGKVHA